jgi:hypothetical protein
MSPENPLARPAAARPSILNKPAEGARKIALGRGVDVGTANLLAAEQELDNGIKVRSERNAFFEIPAEHAANKGMLTRLGVPYATWQDRFYVLGNASFDLANLFAREVRRPMQDGFLAPEEKDAIPMMNFMLERLLGKPQQDGEPVRYCIPATSIDRKNDTVYHEGVVGGLVKKMGYSPVAINEAHAIVYSELEEQDFTGITVSGGGGMFNVCVAYRSIPALVFSVSRGGDWIDEHVAKVMGMTRARATAIKENNINLISPRSREEEAVALYYRSLVEYVVTNLKQRFELATDVPQFTAPVEVVLAGGTSLAGGFAELFTEELKKVGFPVPIARVRRAEDPFTSVVRGCLIAARLEA